MEELRISMVTIIKYLFLRGQKIPCNEDLERTQTKDLMCYIQEGP